MVEARSGDPATWGIVGVGRMGGPMATRLAAQGVKVVAYDVDTANSRRLTSHGVVVAADLTSLVDEADVVLTMLPPTYTRDALVGEAGIIGHVRHGQIVVDGSNSDPDTSREMAALFLAQGVPFLDIGFSGAPERAGVGGLAVMAGGDRAAFDRIAPALAFLGSDPAWLGPSGSGHLSKALNHLVLSVTSQAVSEALAIARGNGMDTRRWLEAATTGTAASWVMDQALRSIDYLGAEAVDPSMNPWWDSVTKSNQLEFSQAAAAHGGVDVPLAKVASTRRTLSADAAGRDPVLETYVRLTWSFSGPNVLPTEPR